MNVVFCAPDKYSLPWLDALRACFPDASIWAWSPSLGGAEQADYAVVWAPPAQFFETQRHLKAVFNIGAGADAVMKIDKLPREIPVIRLNDAGMAVQMAEYVCHALIRHTREFSDYAVQAENHVWKSRLPIARAAWPVGVMGLGSIGARVAQAIASFEYPTFGWSRTPTALTGIATFAGQGQLDRFLESVRVLVCLLPLTPETKGILNRQTLSRLKPQAYLINVARGQHLVEADLIEMLGNGELAGATLDVAMDEPLSPNHPFWRHSKITITPHISAITLVQESAKQIAEKIHALERGDAVEGVINRARGY